MWYQLYPEQSNYRRWLHNQFRIPLSLYWHINSPTQGHTLIVFVSIFFLGLLSSRAPVQIIISNCEDTSGQLVSWEAFGNVCTGDDVLEATSFLPGFANASTAENFTFLRLVNMSDFAVLQRCYDERAVQCQRFEFNTVRLLSPDSDVSNANIATLNHTDDELPLTA